MKEPGRSRFEAGAAGLERELSRLVPVLVPPGLRGRVLARATEARRGALLRPWMRVSAVACSVLILGLFALDPVLARLEEARMVSVLEGRGPVPSNADDAAVLAETMYSAGDTKETARLARLETLAAAGSRRERERQAIAAREWLKGWLENEKVSEDPE